MLNLCFKAKKGAVMRTKKEGFTLVELMVVISIIALLMALLLPSLNKAKESAKRQYCANNLKQSSIAIHAYAGRL